MACAWRRDDDRHAVHHWHPGGSFRLRRRLSAQPSALASAFGQEAAGRTGAFPIGPHRCRWIWAAGRWADDGICRHGPWSIRLRAATADTSRCCRRHRLGVPGHRGIPAPAPPPPADTTHPVRATGDESALRRVPVRRRVGRRLEDSTPEHPSLRCGLPRYRGRDMASGAQRRGGLGARSLGPHCSRRPPKGDRRPNVSTDGGAVGHLPTWAPGIALGRPLADGGHLRPGRHRRIASMP